MGLNKQEARPVYLTVGDGNIVRNHQNPVEGVTQTRINKNGKAVHEEFFSSVTGMLKDIKSKETSFGSVWEVVLVDDGVEFQLSWNYSSRYTNNFFRSLPNVNLNLPVTIHPWMMKDKVDPAKKIVGMFLYQKDCGWEKNKVPFYYTKEEPNGWPEMVQIKRKGKVEWDDTEQLEFIEDLVKTKILPQLGKPAKATAEPIAVEAEEVDEDETPF